MWRLGIPTYGQWSELSRRDRMHWIAFYLLEKEVEAYSMNARDFDSVDFTLGDFLIATESTRDVNIKKAQDKAKA